MCRHVAYAGDPVRLSDLLLDPPHALVHQVRAPRCQLPGVTNEDGWGVAWWDAAGVLYQHRSTTPLPDDAGGQALLRETTAGAFVAAVRRATPGAALDTSGNAPFVAGGFAFSLNGFVGGWFDAGSADRFRSVVSPDRAAALAGDTDSEVLFAALLDRLDAGDDPQAALGAVTGAALEAAAPSGRPSRLNLLLADGERIWASRYANSLFTRPGVVASEPWDDGNWVEVAEQTIIVA